MDNRTSAGGTHFERTSSRTERWRAVAEWASGHPLLVALLIVAVWTMLLLPWRGARDTAQWGLWYMLTVVLAASLSGERAAVTAALLAIVAWNYFFIPPYYTFQIAQPSLWIDLAVFLIVGSIVGLQTAVRRRRELEAVAREDEARVLNRLLGELAVPPAAVALPDVVLDRLADALRPLECALFLARREGGFSRTWRPQPATWPAEAEARIAESFSSVRPLGISEPLNGASSSGTPAVLFLLPLVGPESVFGVLYVALPPDGAGPRAARLAQAIASGLTAHLEHDRLRARAADLEAIKEIDTLKTAFVNSVSHELKTPLASAMATLTGILETPDSGKRPLAETAGELEAVVEDLRRLESNIADLLDMSRLEDAAWQLKRDYYEVGEIIGSVLAGMPVRARERIDLSVDNAIPLVQCDFRQVARALHNLIDNAIAYSAEEDPVLVGARVLGETVNIWVEDRGPGIDPDEREAVFRKFYRSPHVPRHASSTGLGLAITKEIAVRHGGTVWVESVEPHGSRFVFSLPLG